MRIRTYYSVVFVFYFGVSISFSASAQLSNKMDKLTEIFWKTTTDESFYSRNKGYKIEIGDNVPDLTLKVVNSKDSIIALSKLRGKLVILDFWNQWCSGCVDEMKRFAFLQKKFSNTIIILPVTYQSKTSTQEFLNWRRSIGHEILLPSVVEDSLLHRYFPHLGVPFEVWISPTGELLAQTNSKYVTSENIEAALNGNSIKFLDRSLILSENDDSPRRLRYGTALVDLQTPGQIDLNNTLFVDDKTIKKISVDQSSVVDLYIKAYKKSHIEGVEDIMNNDSYQTHKRVLANFNVFAFWDSLYLPGSYTKFNQDTNVEHKLFLYQKAAPSWVSEETMYRDMIFDLDKAFDIKSSIVKTKIKVLKLVKNDGFIPIKPNNQVRETLWNEDLKGYKHNSGFINDYVNEMNLSDVQLPIIYDSTNIKGKIHLSIQLYRNITVQDLRKQLNEFHLDLVPEEKELYMLVLRKNTNSFNGDVGKTNNSTY